ncbi:unnamed protein product [Caenorhabditis angaria]|uniref:CTLH domain-containing protein n=1 Tax=Caenorhabditis angaria TaxID=860376 RepID=A0A9P1ISU4_9PELO|nr:unnamed protein product [Caenorhabditis angaria]
MNDSFESVSPETNEQEAQEEIDNDNRSDSRGSTLSSSPDELEPNDSPNEYQVAEDGNESDWTWDNNSLSSDDGELDAEEDPWYPFQENRRELPNVYLPDKTPASYLPETSTNHEEEETDDDNETKSEKADEDYQNALKNIRPNPTLDDLKKIVLDFFIWNGYEDPIEPFCREMGIEVPHEEIRLMHTRMAVKNLILEGNLKEAIKKINEICPTLLKEEEKLAFSVRRQYIVEMIRSGQTEEPIVYARTHLLKDSQAMDSKSLEILEKTFALMAYEVTDTSPFHYQYDQSERDKISRDVNSAILGKLGKRKYSKLETLTKLITWARAEIAYTPALDPPHNSHYWARQSFESPDKLDDFINLALSKEPLDLTKNLG